MRGRLASLSACLLTVLAALSVPLASGAGNGSRAGALKREDATLASRSRGAVLGLYAIDSRLALVGGRLGELRARAARLERRRTLVRTHVRVAQQALQLSERQLAQRLRALYERGDVDPVAVILGATSLDDAIATLDALTRTAQQNQDVIRQTLTARRRLRALARTLAARQAEVSSAASAAAATLEQLVGARSARTAYLARIARQRRLNAHEIASLQREADAAQAKAAAVNAAASAAPTAAPAAAAAPSSPAPTASGGRTLTVTATGYSLSGRTASGVPVGYGVVAVDPSVIPLGTHMTIPGYGEGVAADTGSAVRGAVVDLWFPTLGQARGWGRRVVTITLH